MLDRIERETNRLDQLIGQLLTLSRLRSREDRQHYEAQDLSQLAREVASDAEFEAASQERRIEIHAGETCPVDGDAELLRSALDNLLRNAIRYTPAGTAVELEVARNPTEVKLLVRDHGAGVPETSLEKLFNPFYRVDGSRNRETGGAGLGLAIVAQVVDAHGGRVRARNRAHGGLEVELCLPVRRGAPAPPIKKS